MSKKIQDSAPEVQTAPLSFKRNAAGLIENFDYKYNEDNSINWKLCLNPKYIVLNKERKAIIEEKYGRGFDELQKGIQEGNIDPEDIEDGHKLILLAGMKELAKIRGFVSVDYHNNLTSPEYVATKCTINWIPNCENQETVSFSSLADAHLGNTKSFATQFLNTIAENRAFVRCVRNFLNIHVVGYDELGVASPSDSNQPTAEGSNFSPTDPRFVLGKRFNELKNEFKVSWETFRKYLVEKKDMDFAAEWKTVDDVSKDKAYEILGLVAEQIEKLTKKKSE